ncbi:response regulator [Labrys okinawensis]|uniref:response regulator n=1 Tax=Labrys okinawensis TaxID=346911 RepID=UPI0039BD09F7
MAAEGEALRNPWASAGPVANSADARTPSLPRPPLVRPASAIAPGTATPDHGPGPLSLTSALILLVESNLPSLLICANELLDEGYEVIECDSAGVAMNMLNSRRDFDVMIADIDLDQAPGGLALVRYVARHLPSMKILIHSTWIDAQAESDVVAGSFLPKPYPVGALVRQVQQQLASPQTCGRGPF